MIFSLQSAAHAVGASHLSQTSTVHGGTVNTTLALYRDLTRRGKCTLQYFLIWNLIGPDVLVGRAEPIAGREPPEFLVSR